MQPKFPTQLHVLRHPTFLNLLDWDSRGGTKEFSVNETSLGVMRESHRIAREYHTAHTPYSAIVEAFWTALSYLAVPDDGIQDVKTWRILDAVGRSDHDMKNHLLSMDFAKTQPGVACVMGTPAFLRYLRGGKHIPTRVYTPSGESCAAYTTEEWVGSTAGHIRHSVVSAWELPSDMWAHSKAFDAPKQSAPFATFRRTYCVLPSPCGVA